jgi:hypothetical protein
MKRTVVSLLTVLALAFTAVPTVFSGSAFAADRTAPWTLKCGSQNSCTATWYWYQGSTLVSSGSASGSPSSQTTGTTVQPSAADRIFIDLSQATCSQTGAFTFAPGSPINFTVTMKHTGGGGYQSHNVHGCDASVSISS